MPYSLYDQLKLFSPKRFEELCGQLLKAEDPSVVPVDGKGGDEGIDIFKGPLDTPKSKRGGRKLHVWQVKHFPTGLGKCQKDQARESLKRVIQTQDPDRWTLCMPFKFGLDDRRWLDEQREKHSLDITEPLDAPAIMALLNKPENRSLLDAHFLMPVDQKVDKQILSLLTDFDLVSERLDEARHHPKTESAFYDGAVADWKDIYDNLDARREIIGELWDFVLEAEKSSGALIPFAVLTGRSGEGKSTVLRRLAAELVRSGRTEVFWHKQHLNDLSPEQFDHLPPGTLVYIFIDSIMLFSPDVINGFLRRLREFPIRPIVISAAINSQWDSARLNVGTSADLQEIKLGHMSLADIEALLDKLCENEALASQNLGKLNGLSRDKQVERFTKKADRQLLVALIEAKGGQGFKQHVLDELRKLGGDDKPLVRQACIYVSALHRFDLRMPKPLLQRLLGEDIFLEDQVLSKTHGLVELIADGDAVITRHSTIADVIYKHEGDDRLDWYERLIKTADETDEDLVERLVYAIAVSDDVARIDWRVAHSLDFLTDLSRVARWDIQAFVLASRQFHWDASAFVEFAEHVHCNGDPSGARAVFLVGASLVRTDVRFWTSWGLMERELGNIGEKECPAEYTARWLLRKAMQTGPLDFQTWFTWAFMERDEGNIGDKKNPAEYTARWILRKGAERYPNEVNFPAHLAKLEMDEGNWDEMYRLSKVAMECIDEPHERSSDFCIWSYNMTELGQADYALAYSQLAVQEDPSNGWAYIQMARCYKDLRRYEDAERSCLRALELRPRASAVREMLEQIRHAREEQGHAE